MIIRVICRILFFFFYLNSLAGNGQDPKDGLIRSTINQLASISSLKYDCVRSHTLMFDTTEYVTFHDNSISFERVDQDTVMGSNFQIKIPGSNLTTYKNGLSVGIELQDSIYVMTRGNWKSLPIAPAFITIETILRVALNDNWERDIWESDNLITIKVKVPETSSINGRFKYHSKSSDNFAVYEIQINRKDFMPISYEEIHWYSKSKEEISSYTFEEVFIQDPLNTIPKGFVMFEFSNNKE